MKAAGFVIQHSTHLDHLGVLCELLNIPLIVTDENLIELAKTYYPALKIERREIADVTSFEILDEFDFLLYTSKVWAYETYGYARYIYNKSTRIVYCPHGNSDKGHSLKEMPDLPPSDIELYYGEHMLRHLKEMGALSSINALVRVGNFRLAYYKKHQSFYDALAQKQIFSQLDIRNPTYLYAPTWSTEECPSSFFTSCSRLIDALPKQANLIVKLHPLLEERSLAQTHRLIGAHSANKQVLFVDTFPPILPLLARCSAYIGDFSSMGYDFLAFDKPLFFFNPLQKERTKSHTLHSVGLTLPQEGNPFTFIENHFEENLAQFSSKRKEMLEITFGSPIRPETIELGITKNLRSERRA